MDLLMFCLVMFFGLLFTYTNGFHDTANAIATVVGTKVLTPRQAIVLAAITNLIGAFFGLAVAKTISSGIVDGGFVTQPVLVCGLVAAIFCNRSCTSRPSWMSPDSTTLPSAGETMAEGSGGDGRRPGARRRVKKSRKQTKSPTGRLDSERSAPYLRA